MNVLLLTDFSEASDNAAKYALDFFRHQPAKFYLLNIHQFNFNTSENKNLDDELQDTLKMLLKKQEDLEQYCKRKHQCIDIVLSSENLITATRNAISEKNIDYVVIGTVSKNVRHHPILGDHAYEVVKKIRSKIMAIPSNSQFASPKNVAFPVDFSVVAKDRILDIMENRNFLEESKISIFELDRDLVSKAPTDELIEHKLAGKTGVEMIQNIQQDYDMILVMGKNLSICDRLLYKDYDRSSKININIPLFVYHG